MSDEEPSEKKQQEMSPIELIAELYRLSDFILCARTAGATPNAQRVDEAKKRLKELIVSQNQYAAKPVPHVDHEWVLGVLKDMSNYAASQHLEALNRDLLHTRARFQQYLHAPH